MSFGRKKVKEVFDVSAEVDGLRNGNFAGSGGNQKNKPLESVNFYTNNGILNISVWEHGRVSFRVVRKNEEGEYEVVWSSRVNGIDFLSSLKDLEKVRDVVKSEIKKLLS